MNLVIILTLSGLLIIAALAIHAWLLIKKVKQAESEAEQQQQQEAAQAAHNLRQKQLALLQDIRFVARSVLAQQCELTEGVLRIQYLISGLDPNSWELAELKHTRAHYEATCDMAILDDYKKLSKKEQFKQDKQRWTLEAENKEAIEQELNWLVAFAFPEVTLLQ